MLLSILLARSDLDGASEVTLLGVLGNAVKGCFDRKNLDALDPDDLIAEG